MRKKYFLMKNSGASCTTSKGKKNKSGLPEEVQLAIRLKVMVTVNLNTDINIMNGVCGEIVGIKLDQHEPASNPLQSQVVLTQLPMYILVKLDKTQAKTVPALEPGISIPDWEAREVLLLTLHTCKCL